ncbi:hypothetical protein ACLBYG_21885 [Methylobacterium sp. D53M]
MPIRPEHRFFYPIDWPQLSAVIRFGRAKGRCEGCGRPHMRQIVHLGDGRWFDGDVAAWRNGSGFLCEEAPSYGEIAKRGRVTRVVLATAHRNHDTSDNRPANLAAWCQRCHMLHDRAEHLRRRALTYRRRRSLGDLFLGAYPRA